MTTPTTRQMPANILLEKYKDIGFFWQGEVLASDLPRLIDELSAKQADNPTLAISCRLQTTDGITRLHFDIVGKLWVACHRCLEATSIDVTGKYGTAILPNANSETLAKLDEDEDYVLFEELTDTRYLPLLDLLEDELLLALPTITTHNDCQALIEFFDEDEVAEEKDNPFAVLADLKGKLS